MAIENTYLLGKNITLGCGFDLQAKAPLDSRQTVPAFAGLQALIDGNAAYEGMIVYDEETKKTYQAQLVDDVLAFREFGINEAELKDLIASETTAAMEFKGAATALPENPAKGDMYKVTASFKVGEEDVKVGDSIVYDGEQWFIIPSGDDIEDTWRPVTGVDNDSTLTFVAGDKLEKTVAADGTVTYKHVAIDAPTNMNEEGDEQTRTYITQLITDNHGHIIGFKTATENVEDTNTTYEFEGLPVGEDEAAPSSVYFQVKSSDAEAAEVIYLDAYNKNEANAELAKKVDKVEGYSLVSDTEIARLADVDNYDDEEVRGLIGDNADAIEALTEYVGTIPNVPDEDGNNKYADLDVIGYINKKAQETLAAASGNSSETAASVKQQLDDYIGQNDTRVKAIEDDVAAIKDAETGILKQAQDYADGLAGNYDEAGAAAGVKTELEAEIAKKVDKVEGKSLIDDSEIARLATLANYDDTQVKADIAKKADAEAMNTELGKKVDKVEGKSLIADSEITRLAGMSDGANKVENVGGGKIKIDGQEVTVYAHPDKHAISEIDGLQGALDGKSDDGHKHEAADITNLDSTIKAYDYATKAEAQGYANAKDEAINAAKDAADAAQGDVDTLENYVGKFTPVGTETSVVGYIDAKHDAQQIVINGMINETTGILAQAKGYTDAEVKELSDGQVTTNKNDIAAIKEDIGTVDNLETTNKDITGAINELKAAIGTGGTAAVVTLTEVAPKDGYAKTYSLKQGETVVGTIDIPKDMVVQSGTVETKAEAGDWGEAGTYIHLVLANATNDDIYVNVGTLVDIYKAKANATQVQIAIDSATREISATIVAGSVDTTALADNAVTTAKIADKNVTLGKLSTEVAGAVQTVIQKSGSWDNAEQNAKDYADDEIAKIVGTSSDTAVNLTLNGLQKYIATKIDGVAAGDGIAVDVTGANANKPVISLDEATKASLGNADTAIQSIRVMNPTSDFVSISVDEGVVDTGASKTSPAIIATASMRTQTAIGLAETAVQPDDLTSLINSMTWGEF